MPLYDCFCPVDHCTVEVNHSISVTMRAWDEVCRAAGAQRGKTPASAKVPRMIGPAMLLGTRHGGGAGAEHGGGGCCGVAGRRDG